MARPIPDHEEDHSRDFDVDAVRRLAVESSLCKWKQPERHGDCKYSCNGAGTCHAFRRLGVQSVRGK